MENKSFIGNQASLLWRFMGFFQTPPLRIMHVTVMCIVLMQFLSSTAMSMKAHLGSFWFFADSWHIIWGILLLPLSYVFAWQSLRTRGLKYFFPYLWGDTSQIRKDINTVMQKKLIGPRPGGLPAAIQGLGFGALLMTVSLGFAWYVLWKTHNPVAPIILDVHCFFAFLLGLYAIGHGGMALLHFIKWQSTIGSQANTSKESHSA